MRWRSLKAEPVSPTSRRLQEGGVLSEVPAMGWHKGLSPLLSWRN